MNTPMTLEQVRDLLDVGASFKTRSSIKPENLAAMRDALDAAIAARREAVAFVQMVNDEWKCELTFEGRKRAAELRFGVSVYTQPPAPQVDEAMVARAKVAIGELGTEITDDEMHAALQAALEVPNV